MALLAIVPGAAVAQTSAVPVWDFTGAVGLFEHRPESGDDPYGDHWYATWRAGASVGRYWTPDFKTEVELAATGEGRQYSQRFATVPGSTVVLPYGVQEDFRVTQGSARAVWQFFDNQWIHPYLLAGVSVDAIRRKVAVPEPFFYGDPRLPGSRVPVVPPRTEGPDTAFHAGLVAGGGVKLYVSPSVFANTTLLVTRSKPSASVSWVAGLGMDF